MLREVRRLHALGFAIHLLKPRSKAPVEARWTSGSRKTLEELKNTYVHGMNIGVRLGEASKLGADRFLSVIDCDVKGAASKYALELEAKLVELFGGTLAGAPVVASGRGNGSKHIYVVTSSPIKTRRLAQSAGHVRVHMPSVKPSTQDKKILDAREIADGYRIRAPWEISFMGEGAQVVLPPSVHPDSGKQYVWRVPLKNAEQIPLVEWEDKAEKSEAAADVAEEFSPEEVFLDFEPISDRIRNMITKGEGCDDRSAGLFAAALAMCGAGLSDNAILTVLTDRENFLGEVAYGHTQSGSRKKAAEWIRKYTLKRARYETSAARDFEDMVEIEKLGSEEAEAQAKEMKEEIAQLSTWRSLIERSGKDGDGPPKTTLKNVVLILENGVSGKPFYRNLFSMRDFYGCNTPWGGKKSASLADEDIVKIKMWLAHEFRLEPPQNLIIEAVTFLASKNASHPVQEYLKGLKWDGRPRIDSWLHDYLGVHVASNHREYFSAISRKYLLAMVARVMKPGCQADSFLVLEGVQGIGKSSTGRILAGSEWYCDTLPDIKDKDAMLNLQGAWLVEISELAVLRNAQSQESYKAFLTRRVDRIRAPYGRLTNDVPRQCMFLGTTNDDDYLKDKGGNRRFWPAKATRCDFEGLARDRDQLFAEAYARWKTEEEPLDLRGAAKEQGEAEQRDRVVEDEFDHMERVLLDWIEKEMQNPPEARFSFSRFRLSELFDATGPLDGRFPAKNYYLQIAGRVLTKLGGRRRAINGYPHWSLENGCEPKEGTSPLSPEMW